MQYYIDIRHTQKMDDTLLRIGALCLGHRARVTARALTRHYNARLRPLDLTAGQFALLAALQASEPPTLQLLAERLGTDPTTLVRGIQQLQARGLAATDGGRGRRGKRTTLTTAGRKLLKRAVPLWEAAYSTLVAALGGESRATALRKSLRALEEASLDCSAEIHP